MYNEKQGLVHEKHECTVQLISFDPGPIGEFNKSPMFST